MLVGLYEEPDRPPNAVEYMRKYMGASAGVDVDAMRAENERLKAQVAELTAQLDDAKAKVCRQRAMQRQTLCVWRARLPFTDGRRWR